MHPEQMIPVNDYCALHQLDVAFIYSLQEYGLIEITRQEETVFLHYDQLHRLEQLARLHYELDINLEGIDAIANLLQRVETMQDEIRLLKNRLRGFEEPM